MDLTVEEASNKMCPMSFSVHVAEESDYKESVYACCRTNRCMAWAWVNEEESKGYCRLVINKMG